MYKKVYFFKKNNGETLVWAGATTGTAAKLHTPQHPRPNAIIIAEVTTTIGARRIGVLSILQFNLNSKIMVVDAVQETKLTKQFQFSEL